MGVVRFFKGTQAQLHQRALEGMKFTRIKDVYYCEDNEGLYFVIDKEVNSVKEENGNFISKNYEDIVVEILNEI